MAPDIKTIVRNSIFYRTVTFLSNSGKQSRLWKLLDNEYVLTAGVCLLLVVSVLRILFSGLHVTVQFVSLLLLAAVLWMLVRPYTKPIADE